MNKINVDTLDISGCGMECHGGFSMDKAPHGNGDYVKTEDCAKMRDELSAQIEVMRDALNSCELLVMAASIRKGE